MAFLKYKIKSVFPALIFAAVALVIFCGLLFVESNEFTLYDIEYGTYYLNRFVNNLFYLPFALLILAIWLGMGLTKEYGSPEKEGFIGSLPYKKSTRFLLSAMSGVAVFVIFGLVLSIGVCISHSMTYEFYSEMNMFDNYYKDIMKMDGAGNAIFRVWQIIVTTIMVYFVTFFASVISRNKIVAVFIIVIICIFPFFVPVGIDNIAVGYFGVNAPLYEEIITYGSLVDIFTWEDEYDGWIVRFANIYGHTAVMGVLAMVYASLSYFATVKMNRAGGKIVINTVLEKICVVLAGILGGFLVPIVMDVDSVMLPVLIVIMVVVGAVIGFGLNRLVAGKSKYNYLNLSLVLVLFLTGCGKSEDFISKISNDSNPGLMIDTEYKDLYSYGEGQIVYRGVDKIVKEALQETFLKDYFTDEIDEDGFYIDSLMYLSDYALRKNIPVVELPENDRKLMYVEPENFNNRYTWVRDNELIYLVNEDGNIIGDRAYLLISQLEEVKNALVENDQEMVYEVFSLIDNEIIENINSLSHSKNSADVFNSHVIVNPTNICIIDGWVFCYEDAKYLCEYEKVDGFSTIATIANDGYEAVSLLYYGDFDLDAEYYNGYPKSTIRLDVFGKDEKLQEIKLVCHKDTDKIPELCVPTMESYIAGLGASEGEIAEFMKALPKDDEKIGNLICDVESWEEYLIIKIYTK